MARAHRLVEDNNLDCAERGFLMLPAGFATLFEGGAAAAYGIFAQAAAIGERFAEPDLIAWLARARAQALLRAATERPGSR